MNLKYNIGTQPTQTTAAARQGRPGCMLGISMLRE